MDYSFKLASNQESWGSGLLRLEIWAIMIRVWMLRGDMHSTVLAGDETQHKAKILPLLALLLALGLLILSPTLVSAFAGFGGYIGEKLLGDGTNEALYLGDGTNEMIVLGSGPVTSTLPVMSSTTAGGGQAVLRGNLGSLNGMPRADVWFVWGYSPSVLTNSTSAKTVFGAGEQSATITGFETKQDVYYQFVASTDGTSSGAVMSFVADKGFALLEVALPIVIALAILIFIISATGNPILALLGSLIGLIGFYIVMAMLEAIK